MVEGYDLPRPFFKKKADHILKPYFAKKRFFLQNGRGR